MAQPRYTGNRHYNLDRERAFNSIQDKISEDQKAHVEKREQKKLEKDHSNKRKLIKNVEKLEVQHAKNMEKRMDTKKKREEELQDKVKKKQKERNKKQKHAELDRKRARKEERKRQLKRSVKREL